MKLRVIFLGNSDFSRFVIENISDYFDIVGAITNPDAKTGRKGILVPNPVKSWAEENSIEIEYSVKNIKEMSVRLKPDFFLVASYGVILKRDTLNTGKFLNVHGSFLPELRGAIPIQMSIFKGLKTGGVSVIEMDEGMDTGRLLGRSKVEIGETDNFKTLSLKLAQVGSKILKDKAEGYLSGNVPDKQEQTGATYCYMKDIKLIKQYIQLIGKIFLNY